MGKSNPGGEAPYVTSYEQWHQVYGGAFSAHEREFEKAIPAPYRRYPAIGKPEPTIQKMVVIKPLIYFYI